MVIESGFIDANTVFFDNLMVSHSPGRLLEENHYYPYGLLIPGLSSSATIKDERNSYKYNRKELQEELGLGWLDYGARMQNSAEGRFMVPDRFAEKYYHLSPYSYAAGNPINNIDVNGDSIWAFKPDGSFFNVLDDGKKTHTGLYMQDSQRNKNNDGSYTTIYSNGYAFEFNDPEIDTKGIKNRVINRIEFMTDDFLQSKMEESGVLNPDNGLFYAKNQSTGGGKMDYAMGGIIADEYNQNTFYITDGIAYNVADFGNYLWGMGMSKLGVPLWLSRTGAHWNNITSGKKDYTKQYNFGKGTYGNPGIFDSPGDQRAIKRGHIRGSR